MADLCHFDLSWASRHSYESLLEQSFLWTGVLGLAAFPVLGMVFLMIDATRVTAPRQAKVWERIYLGCVIVLLLPFFALIGVLMLWAIAEDLVSWALFLLCAGSGAEASHMGAAGPHFPLFALSAALVGILSGVVSMRRRSRRPKS